MSGLQRAGIRGAAARRAFYRHRASGVQASRTESAERRVAQRASGSTHQLRLGARDLIDLDVDALILLILVHRDAGKVEALRDGRQQRDDGSPPMAVRWHRKRGLAQFVLALRSTCPGPPREETRPDWVLWAYLGPLARALFLSLDLLAGRALMWDNLGGSLPSRRY